MRFFLAFDTTRMTALEAAEAWAVQNHVFVGHQFIGPDKIGEIEPHVSKKAIGVLYGKGAKIFFII